MPTSQERLHEIPIRYVKGVGPGKAKLLAQLGIETIEDALYYPPKRYEDRSRLSLIRELKMGQDAAIRVKVMAKTLRRARGGRNMVEAAFADSSGVMHALWFHQPYLAQSLKIGDEYILFGRIEGRVRFQMIHPEMERVEEGVSVWNMERIVPIYPLTSRLTQRWFRMIMGTVLEQHVQDAEDPLPQALRVAQGWPALSTALYNLHFPENMESLAPAQSRLAFEELFLLQLALAQRRSRAIALTKPQRYTVDGPMVRGLRESLPFKLTGAQERVLTELLSDLSRPGPMYRLLQGDVGCGKTIILAFLTAAAVQSGHQVAIMAPTELLAEQHERVMKHYLEPLGVSVGLLSQGVPTAVRKQRVQLIQDGKLSVIIGTHALIQRAITFERLALVIIDEQHKFGVSQRSALAKKGERPDVLVLTATPIPRTLALSLYGALATSTITEMPPGRATVTTTWMPQSRREEAYAVMKRELAQGHQGYVVYPLVEESATKDLKAASTMAKRLQAAVFPEMMVGLLHGQLKPSTKERIMRHFLEGKIQVLVSTVIVEVGLDVPNATFMLIEHPQRYGLAQLHQLRGRIGRSRFPATCLVVSDAEEEAARQRLLAFTSITDGFVLAEKDLELRGPGQLLGKRQHGWMRFRIASLSRDGKLLEFARNEAVALIKRDPDLIHPGLNVLRARLNRFKQNPA